MVLPTALVCVLVVVTLAPPASGEDAGSFRDTVQPLVEAYCLDCHGPGTQKAGLRLDTLAADISNEKVLATWIRVHDKLVAGEMPLRSSRGPSRRS
jgi:hypothetical protein